MAYMYNLYDYINRIYQNIYALNAKHRNNNDKQGLSI